MIRWFLSLILGRESVYPDSAAKSIEAALWEYADSALTPMDGVW